MSTLDQRLAPLRARADAALDRFLPRADEAPRRLHEAMRYAVLAPGKRIRPVLTYATGAALDVALNRIAAVRADALVVSLGLDTFAGDPISTFQLEAADFLRLGQRLAAVRLPVAFILEGGYAAADLGVNAANVLDGFEQACA